MRLPLCSLCLCGFQFTPEVQRRQGYLLVLRSPQILCDRDALTFLASLAVFANTWLGGRGLLYGSKSEANLGQDRHCQGMQLSKNKKENYKNWA